MMGFTFCGTFKKKNKTLKLLGLLFLFISYVSRVFKNYLFESFYDQYERC